MAHAAPQASTPREWLRAAMNELRGAERALRDHDRRAGVLGVKRASGMALHGLQEPGYGKTYVEHVAALAEDESAPEAVRAAARRVHQAQAGDTRLVMLRAPANDERLLEAARDVLAHAYARIVARESAS